MGRRQDTQVAGLRRVIARAQPLLMHPSRGLFASKDFRGSLRAVHVTANKAARHDGFAIFENMRVLGASIIYRVFEGLPYGEAVENLSSWETGKGFTLPDRLVEVKAKRSWESADTLIIPKKRRRSIR